MKLVRFQVQDRCNNVRYLDVFEQADGSARYLLFAASGTPLALGSIVRDIGFFPAFVSANTVELVKRVLLDHSYVDSVSVERNPKVKGVTGLVEILREIHDEAEHAIGTEADNPYEVARTNAFKIRELAVGALDLVGERVEVTDAT